MRHTEAQKCESAAALGDGHATASGIIIAPGGGFVALAFRRGTSSDQWLDDFYRWLEAHGFAARISLRSPFLRTGGEALLALNSLALARERSAPNVELTCRRAA